MTPIDPQKLKEILDADGRIGTDLPCARCGYSMRTRRPGEFCPECGAPVADAIMADPLRLMGKHRLGRMRLGMGILLIAMVLSLIPGVRNFHSFGGTPFGIISSVLLLASQTLIPVGGVIFSLGFRDPNQPALANVTIGLGIVNIGNRIVNVISGGLLMRMHFAQLDLMVGWVRGILVTMQLRTLFGAKAGKGFNVYDLLPWLVGIEVVYFLPQWVSGICCLNSCLNLMVGLALFYGYAKAYWKIGMAMETALAHDGE